MTENNDDGTEQGEVVPASGGEQQVAEGAADGTAAPAQDAGQQARQPTAGESFMAITKSLIIRAIIIYFITSFFRRPQQPTGPQGTAEGQPDPSGRVPALNLFQDGDSLDLYVYISESEFFSDFRNPNALVWLKEDLIYGDWTSGPDGDGTYSHSITFPTSENLRNNGSLYIHAYFVKTGFSPDPEADEGRYNRKLTTHSTQRLNKYKRRRYRKTSNLLTGETQLSEEERLKAETLTEEIVSHWHPNITVNIVHDFTQWTRGMVPAPLDEYLEFTPAGDRYKPITFLNTYWNLVKDYRSINATTKMLDLTVTFQPLSLFKWQLYAAQAMKNRWPGTAMLENFGGEEDEEDQDTIKEAFLETSPYLLALTMIISLLHSVFEFLAFKNEATAAPSQKSKMRPRAQTPLTCRTPLHPFCSPAPLGTPREFLYLHSAQIDQQLRRQQDYKFPRQQDYKFPDIQFWNNRQSLEGLSVRSVFFNVFQSVIVLLYVLDNETNFVIKVSCFIGLAIELWKITKVTDVSINREKRVFGIPLLKFTDKGTYIQSHTRQYDELAFRYLSIALFPLLGGYCVYSLFYQEHKGWYSFVLSMLYGFLLTFGFIMMTPQLFINYKLKSVAHLPWRMLTYKALNTFIDDIFAFVIKMPTMYRLGCLRDDVIFFIFLYQRYIYRVDPSRVNEFGFSQDMETEAREKKQNEAVVNGSAIEEPKSAEDKKKD